MLTRYAVLGTAIVHGNSTAHSKELVHWVRCAAGASTLCFLSLSAHCKRFNLCKLKGILYGSTVGHRQLGIWLVCGFQNHSLPTFILLLFGLHWLEVPWPYDFSMVLVLDPLMD